jgi:hypothetical protein
LSALIKLDILGEMNVCKGTSSSNPDSTAIIGDEAGLLHNIARIQIVVNANLYVVVSGLGLLGIFDDNVYEVVAGFGLEVEGSSPTCTGFQAESGIGKGIGLGVDPEVERRREGS